MIKLSELIRPDGVLLDVAGEKIDVVLDNITAQLAQNGLIEQDDRQRLVEVIKEREKLCSTAVGLGAAIPHAYFDKLPKPMVVICRLQQAVEYCTPDERPDEHPVDLIFLLLGPQRDDASHIQILSKIVRMIKDEKFDKDLRAARSPEQAMDAVFEVEQRHH